MYGIEPHGTLPENLQKQPVLVRNNSNILPHPALRDHVLLCLRFEIERERNVVLIYLANHEENLIMFWAKHLFLFCGPS
jgi:hypothetical protein